MSVAIDASTPVNATGTGAAITTASFTPPAGSLIVLLYGCNDGTDAADTSITSVTNTGTAITWTRRARRNLNAGSTGGVVGTVGGAEIWTGIAPGGAITVTANGFNSGLGFEKMLKAMVFTGADTTNLANVAAASGSGTPVATVPSCREGSYVVATSSDVLAKGLGTPGTAQTMIDEFNVTGQVTIHAWRTTSAIVVDASQQMNTSPSAEQYNLVALEIRAAIPDPGWGALLAEDGSYVLAEDGSRIYQDTITDPVPAATLHVKASSGFTLAATNPVTIAFPTPVAVGDVIGIWLTVNSATSLLSAAPAGWNPGYNVAFGTAARVFIWKVYAASDGAGVVTNWAATPGGTTCVVAVLDGQYHSGFSLGAVTTRGATIGTTTAAAPGGDVIDPILVVSHEKAATHATPPTVSPATTAIQNVTDPAASSGAIYVGWYDPSSAGQADRTLTYSATSANGAAVQAQVISQAHPPGAPPAATPGLTVWNGVSEVGAVLTVWDGAAEDPATLLPSYAGPTGYSAVVSAIPSLLRRWTLDDLTGAVAAAAAGGVDGAYVGSPTLGVTGLVTSGGGKAVALDGNTQEITTPVAGLSSACSILFTFATTDTSSSVLFRDDTSATGAGWFFQLATGTNPPISRINGVNRTHTGSSNTLRDGGTHMVLLTSDGTTVTLYIDGVQLDQWVPTSALASGIVTPLHFGRNGSSTLTTNYYAVTYDELAVFSAALTSSDAAALWAART